MTETLASVLANQKSFAIDLCSNMGHAGYEATISNAELSDLGCTTVNGLKAVVAAATLTDSRNPKPCKR